MTSTGIIKHIDDLGRVVIPKELRRAHMIGEGDPIEIFTGNGYISFKKYLPGTDIVGHITKPIEFVETFTADIGEEATGILQNLYAAKVIIEQI